MFAGGVGAVELLLVLVVMVGAFVLWLVFLIEALRVPDADWTAAGQNKLVWVLVMVLLGVLGTILYVAVARRAVLQRSAA